MLTINVVSQLGPVVVYFLIILPTALHIGLLEIFDYFMVVREVLSQFAKN